MSDCIHCDIHELLESRLQNQEVNLVEIAAKVTEVLADLILTAPNDDQSKFVVIEFGDYATALECYHSPEYAKAIEIRKGSAVADIIIVEGYHGAQPTDG